MIELLVVLAIITVVVSLGIPLFGTLTGAKSVEAGRNVVAATVGAARAAAINDGKYAGVLFYVDPRSGRTAMSVVNVNVGGNKAASSGLEDADPYDKYKTWVAGQEYKAPIIDQANGLPIRGDRVIGLAVDADATFNHTVYDARNTNYENNLYKKFFSNYRPVVRTYRCTEENNGPDSPTAQRPPRNGPYGPYEGSARQDLPPQFLTLGEGATAPKATTFNPGEESKEGPFGNQWWDAQVDKEITRYEAGSSGEQLLLPTGIGAQVIIDPESMPGPAATAPKERYLRTALIMFDPQGRLVQQSFALSVTDPLGQYLLLTNSAPNIKSGMGLVLFDQTIFTSVTQVSDPVTDASAMVQMSNADAIHQNAPNNPFILLSEQSADRPVPNPALNDRFSAADVATNNAQERLEEIWLDNNTTPLLINRFSGSMTETD